MTTFTPFTELIVPTEAVKLVELVPVSTLKNYWVEFWKQKVVIMIGPASFVESWLVTWLIASLKVQPGGTLATVTKFRISTMLFAKIVPTFAEVVPCRPTTSVVQPILGKVKPDGICIYTFALKNNGDDIVKLIIM